MSDNIAITICGRGGSKGIPGKNIRPLAGKPLIAYSIEQAQEFAKRFAADILLSTDDIEIKSVAADWGLKSSYVRPADLANDKVGKLDAIIHVVGETEKEKAKIYDYVIDIDITAPLRTGMDIVTCYENLKNDPNAINLFSVRPAHRNPYFNMVEKQENGYFHLVKKPDREVLSRQSSPAVYDMDASIYVYRRHFLMGTHQPTITQRSLVYVMPHISFDIDEPVDFEIMEYILTNKKLEIFGTSVEY